MLYVIFFYVFSKNVFLVEVFADFFSGEVRAMEECYGARAAELHVRESNRVALGLYREGLGFE